MIRYPIILLAAALPVAGQSAAPAGFRDAATHDTLAGRAAAPNPIAGLKPVERDPAVEVKRKPSFLQRMEFLCFRGFAVLLPKGALLHAPSGLEDRVGRRQGCELIAWSEFVGRNRSWLRTVEVSRDQAEGREALPEEWKKQFEEDGRVVVSVIGGCPTSVVAPSAQSQSTEQ